MGGDPAPHQQHAVSTVGSQDQTAEVAAEGHSDSAADQAPQPSNDPAEPSAGQKQQAQLDADSARADSGTQASESGSQQSEEDAWQQGKGGRKVRAVDADYSVTAAKTGRKSQAKPARKSELESVASNAASSVSQEGDMQQQASTGMGNQSEAPSSAILPPKPKPGAPKARKASQPASKDAVACVAQGQGAAPPQLPSRPPQQAAPQRPAPQQPQAQGPSSRKPSVQAPSAPSSCLPIYKPAPAAIPLAANSAWAKKLDLQPVIPPKTAPIARPTPSPTQPPPPPQAAVATPRPEPSQAALKTVPIARPTPPILPAAKATPCPEPSQAAATSASSASSTTAPSTVKVIPMADRPSSAGAKGKGKGKKKGQGQASLAQPSAPASAASGQRSSAVKEVPAIRNDSRPRASHSTVLTAPGLVEQPPHASDGLQGQPLKHPPPLCTQAHCSSPPVPSPPCVAPATTDLVNKSVMIESANSDCLKTTHHLLPPLFVCPVMYVLTPPA